MKAQPAILCIVPPHMLREIAERGTLAQRDIALKTITSSEQIRGQRRAIKEVLSLMELEISGEKERIVYDVQLNSLLPGTPVRREGDPPVVDQAVNEAYDGSGLTYDLYLEAFGRNSIDDQGMRIGSSVHYLKGYDNAFWDGIQMVYGDGDEDLPESERLFNRFTKSLDIIGHELTHGVTQYEANLVYWDQSGALNESFSDIFGSLVKQYHRRETAQAANWIIGEGLFTGNVAGNGIRSMVEPGTAYDDPILGEDPQPGHMRDFVDTADDNGGVHINSGIPNRAFALAALEIGGFAWEKAGQIWYRTLTEKLGNRASFLEAAALTVDSAGELFGTGSLEQKAVKRGWAQVGLDIGPLEEQDEDGGAPGDLEQGEGCLTATLRMLGIGNIRKHG